MLVQESRPIPPASGTLISFDRILLTGFRATGKSLIGRQLATLLHLEFLDTDTLLCRQFGCSVTQFVGQQGWDQFRKQEKQLLQDLCQQTQVVIATGGGAILHAEAWQELRKKSFSIWLQAEEQTIQQRLSGDARSDQQRPSLTGKDLHQEVEMLLAERTPFYQRGSDFALQTDGHTPQELLDKIMRHLILMGEAKK